MAPRRAGADTRLRVPWVPDAEAQVCGPCGRGFGVFLRRHHCRCCGGVFCNTCSASSRSGLPGYSGPQRICNACAKAVDQRPSTPSTPPPTPLLAEPPPSTEATPDDRHLQPSSAAASNTPPPAPAAAPQPLRIPTLRIGDDSDGGAAAAAAPAASSSGRLLPLRSPSVAAAAAASLRRLPPAAASASSTTPPPHAQQGASASTPRRRPLRRRQAATPPSGPTPLLPPPPSPRGGRGAAAAEAGGDGACRACLAPAAAHSALFAVRVVVHEARGLAAGRLTAPNVSFVLRAGEGGHEAGRTRTVRASHAPRFDEAFSVRAAAPTDSLYIAAYDEGVLADHVLGRASVPLSTLGAGGDLHRVWLHLLPCESAYQASHRFRSGVRASHMKRPRGCPPGGADEGPAAVAGAPLGAVCVSVSSALSAANPYAYLALFCDGEERRRRGERLRRSRHRRGSSHLRAGALPAAAAAAAEGDSDASSADAAEADAEAVSSDWDSSAPSSGLFSLGDHDSDWSDNNEAAAAAAAAAATVAEAEEFQAQELVMHARRLWDLWGARTPAMMEALLRLPKPVRAVVGVPTWGCVVVWGAGVGPAAAPLLLLLAAALDALAKEPYEPERVPVFEPAEEATAPVSRRLRKAYRTVHEFPLLLAKIQWGLAALASFFEKLGFLLSFVHPTLSLAFFAALTVSCVAASLLLCVVPVRLVVFLLGARVIMQGGRRSRWVHRLTRRPKKCVRWVAALVLHFWRNVPDVLEVEHRAIAVAVRSGVPPRTQHRGGGRQRRATVLTPRVGGAASGVLFA